MNDERRWLVSSLDVMHVLQSDQRRAAEAAGYIYKAR
jgi:hypothetical protein